MKGKCLIAKTLPFACMTHTCLVGNGIICIMIFQRHIPTVLDFPVVVFTYDIKVTSKLGTVNFYF